MTQAPSLVQLFIVPLNAARMEYMVTGGLGKRWAWAECGTHAIAVLTRLCSNEGRDDPYLEPSMPQSMSPDFARLTVRPPPDLCTVFIIGAIK